MIKKIVFWLDNLINREQNSIGAAAIEMMVITVLTKALGVFKMALITGKFGASRPLDIFYAANTIPEVIFDIIAIGSINAAFIPVFTKALSREKNEGLTKLLQSIVNWTFVAFVIFSTVVFIFAPLIVRLALKVNIGGVQTDFSQDDIFMTVLMMRLMLVSPILLGLSSVFSAYLMVRRRFFITRVAPFLYNIGTIFGVLIFVPLSNGEITGLAFGVILSSFLHLFSQLPTLDRLRFNFNLKVFSLAKEYIRDIINLAIPRSFSVAIAEINILIRNVIAFNLVEGSLAAYNLARNVFLMAADVFGFTVAQAFFPQLSKLYAEKNCSGATSLFRHGIDRIVLLTLPVSIILLVLRVPIVRITYGIIGHAFTWDDTVMTSWSLLFWSPLVMVEAIMAMLLRGFYSIEDTKTPFYVSFFSFIVNIPLTVFFVTFFSNFKTFSLVQPYGELGAGKIVEFLTKPGGSPVAIGGLGVATLAIDIVETSILFFLLNRKIRFVDKKFLWSILKKLISGVFMGLSLYGSFRFFEIILDTQRVLHLVLVLVGSLVIGASVFVSSEYIFDDESVDAFIKAIKSFFGRGKVLFDKTKVLIPFVREGSPVE